ncbi:hypothetical protein LOTGIDRAFT_172064 [Lottia gigantea]|uniref:Farnesoic acid O-methyl transferase domain-containing protein n=1 Tax=Lottia gigantea TaxID=225164 RepID=V4B4K4_LOTGI|nr:hypothetical protein LOTGIDRAFT_172064 [Lottia gigantea]ESP02406.1 hypothetical protein LOTGIDRAFT_172064 [Lottia gigantea]
MTAFSLFWKLHWIYLLDLVHFAECGTFFTKALREVSYIQNVSEQNHLVFALKSDPQSVVYLYNDVFKTGAVAMGKGSNPKIIFFAIDCDYPEHLHTSDLATPTEYSWLWIKWTGTQLKFGTGKTPGVDLVYSTPFSHDVKYIGFAKYGRSTESHWIVGQTNEHMNESEFKKTEGRRIRDTSSAYHVSSSFQCAEFCLSLNGCYGFNLSLKVNGFSVCELIQKDMEYIMCNDIDSLDWTVEENSTWTHYYL